ncbi:2OG-Fe(II) oxygenase family protein [Ensifer soli]|uniref:2OG-Fe(II) oxygenase family protein n=1 Tax=Ciceribacter sp. sgz301302 TaxID=3342379 RepID=UPI0035B84B4C
MTQPSAQPHAYAALLPGDPAPWFHQRSTANPRYAFDTAAGRYILIGFFGSAADPRGRAALDLVARHRGMFDDETLCFFGVSVDPSDETEGRVRESIPGIRHFWDFDATIGRLYGAVPKEADSGQVPMRQIWVLLDPTLRVIAVMPFGEETNAALFSLIGNLPRPDRFAGFEIFAPVLVLPNVFEPELCEEMIALYEENGGRESGFMREVDGKTVLLHDNAHKRRRDHTIDDQKLIGRIQNRIVRRVNPEIAKVHSFKATRMERYIVSCYAAEDGGHFRAHRDNTTKGTAHRRFAVSINLNGDFDGGELSFPEYGPRRYKAPPGGAVVFSGALLHAVSPVTRGRRYAFLPFVYDEEAARLREQNAKFLEGDAARYKAG